MSTIAKILGFLAGATAMTNAAGAGQTISTDSFSYTAPDGWITDLKARPAAIRGPKGQLLQFSSTNISGSGNPADAKKILQELEDAAVRSMLRVAGEAPLRIKQPLARKKLQNGVILHEVSSLSADNKLMFVGFVLTGPRTVVLATLDLSSAESPSIELVRHSLQSMRWVP